MELLRSLARQPLECCFNVADQVRKLRFRGESIIDRYQGITVFRGQSAHLRMDPLSVSHDQRPTVYPDDHRTHVVTLRAIDVRQDSMFVDFAVGNRCLYQFGLCPGGLRMRHGERKE